MACGPYLAHRLYGLSGPAFMDTNKIPFLTTYFYSLIFNFSTSYIWKELKVPIIIDINWYSYHE